MQKYIYIVMDSLSSFVILVSGWGLSWTSDIVAYSAYRLDDYTVRSTFSLLTQSGYTAGKDFCG